MKTFGPSRGTRYFCIGVNYPDRNEEYKDGSERPKYPSIFIRTHTSFVSHGEPIVRPRESEQLDYEARSWWSSAGVAEDSGRFGAISRQRLFLRERGLGARLVAAFKVQCDARERTSTGPVPSAPTWSPLKKSVRDRSESSLASTAKVRQNDTSDRMIFPIPYLISYLSTFCSWSPAM